MDFFYIHSARLIKSLSLALELAFTGMSKHHWRTASICRELSLRLSMDEMEQQQLVYAALLHDIGAASNWDERQRIRHADFIDVKEIYTHAEAGYHLLKDSVQFGYLADPIRYHHDLWCGGNFSGRKGKAIPLAARIIHLADRIEVLIDDSVMVLLQKRKIIDRIVEKSGRDFDPAIVEAFQACAQADSFWLDLTNPGRYEEFFESLSCYTMRRYSINDAIQISEIFATIIDKTSAFTATHSRSVAGMSVFLAEIRGFGWDELQYMQIAGLLHDIGKLAVPNEILEKPGSLTYEEVMVIRQHTYYTYQILKEIDNFKEIAKWAAYHHETLDGLGYPFQIKGDSLPLGSRIVAVADLFVALTEDRPYRKSLPEAQVRSIIAGMVKNNKIDGSIVSDLFARFDEASNLVNEIQRHSRSKYQ